MNVLTADTQQKAGLLEISVLSAIKHTGNAASVGLYSLQPCCRRNVPDVERSVNSSTSRVTHQSAAGPDISILA